MLFSSKSKEKQEIEIGQNHGFDIDTAFDKVFHDKYLAICQELSDTRKAATAKIAALEATVASLEEQLLRSKKK